MAAGLFAAEILRTTFGEAVREETTTQRRGLWAKVPASLTNEESLLNLPFLVLLLLLHLSYGSYLLFSVFLFTLLSLHPFLVLLFLSLL